MISHGGSSGGSSGGASYGGLGSVTHSASYASYASRGSRLGSRSPLSMELTSNVEPDAIHLFVDVPEDARVFVNGRQTRSTGIQRHFTSRGLVPGSEYNFELRVETEVDGELVTETRTVAVVAGESHQLAFDLGQPGDQADQAVETVLTVNVPSGAKIRLAGSETLATGTQRVFRTTALANGQVWDDYTVEVTIGSGSDAITKVERLRLIGGDQLELSFDGSPATDRLAAR
jgi:uncharacterized protein (TIGR03000 family)